MEYKKREIVGVNFTYYYYDSPMKTRRRRRDASANFFMLCVCIFIFVHIFRASRFCCMYKWYFLSRTRARIFLIDAVSMRCFAWEFLFNTFYGG
jgi:hypothetical protein